MREVIWHKDSETGRYTLIKPWVVGSTMGMVIADVFHNVSKYHFTTTQQTLSALGDIASILLAAALGVATVAAVVLAFRMLQDRRRAKLENV